MALTLFLYHSIDDSGSFLSVAPARFRRQIAAIARSGRRVLTVAQAAEAARRGDRLADAVCITFDDAYLSVAEQAWPVLRDHGMAATVYCVSGLMGKTARWLPQIFPEIFSPDDDVARNAFERSIGRVALRDKALAADPVGTFRRAARLPIMDWATARALIREGMDPGGHTQSHPFLTQSTPAHCLREIHDDKAALQDGLGCAVQSFAYPFGAENADIRRAVAAAGYAVAVTSRAGVLHNPAAAPMAWPRIGVWPAVGGLKMRFYLSGLYGHLRRMA